jgi:uncharacterized protein (TIGR02145 family)
MSRIFLIYSMIPILLFSISACKFEDPEPVFEVGSVTDVEGNIYKTVKVGSQEWMAENLYTQTFYDGTEILYIGGDTLSWMNNNLPAYTWFGGDEQNRPAYGALYNWFAVSHEAGLCPDGWRIFSRNDWDRLQNYLMKRHRRSNDPIDNVNAVGKMLKSCRQVNNPHNQDCSTDEHPRWNANDIHSGTNDYEFDALPGGIRRSTGGFSGRGAFALWWTTTTAHVDSAAVVYLTYDYSKVFGKQPA